MKINKTSTRELETKIREMLKCEETTFKESDGKKVVDRVGKGDESPSLYFRHVKEELSRRA